MQLIFLILNKNFKCNRWLRWCTAPHCPLVIRADPMLKLDYKQNCMCLCGQRFCFNCRDECHDPLPCDLISKWKKHDYSKIAVYLTLDLKNCPNCALLIEKNGGCNRMVSEEFFGCCCSFFLSLFVSL